MAEQMTARLLGDVGGTNARFAWQDGAGTPLRDIVALATADFATLADAITAYLGGLGRAAPPWCAIGIANPITGDQIRMTNCRWAFSISGMQQALGLERLVVINDFTALALGARGGVYIGGGIVPRLGDAFARSRFRACFEDKGRFRAYLEAIPVFVIHTEVSPALLGAARAL